LPCRFCEKARQLAAAAVRRPRIAAIRKTSSVARQLKRVLKIDRRGGR
jgi:hypothetical protein